MVVVLMTITGKSQDSSVWASTSLGQAALLLEMIVVVRNLRNIQKAEEVCFFHPLSEQVVSQIIPSFCRILRMKMKSKG